jgi:hypothetical protein
MNRRTLTAGLIAVALLVSACGDDDEVNVPATGEGRTTTTTAAPEETAPEETAPEETARDGEEAIEVSADVPDTIPAGEHTFSFELTNVSEEPLTITFPSAQTGEALLLAEDGTVVYRWSEGQFFTQQLMERTLAPGEALEIELPADLSDVSPGTYELVLEPTTQSPVGHIVELVEVVEA